MSERRVPIDHRDPRAVPCRQCFSWQPLDSSRIEVVDGRVWQRCFECEGWFLVRWDDAASLGLVAPYGIGESPVAD